MSEVGRWADHRGFAKNPFEFIAGWGMPISDNKFKRNGGADKIFINQQESGDLSGSFEGATQFGNILKRE